ncbi:MAG: hypothetical protein ABI664_20750, partial [bacterium]
MARALAHGEFGRGTVAIRRDGHPKGSGPFALIQLARSRVYARGAIERQRSDEGSRIVEDAAGAKGSDATQGLGGGFSPMYSHTVSS